MAAFDRRLYSAAKFVRQGAVFADIGTDHAHLPIFLLRGGKIKHAVLSDVNRGPLASAEKNVNEAGYSHLVTVRLTDGAEGLDGLGITDYAICGMGGELIRDIIRRSPHLYKGGIRLILQPMTRHGVLRRFLADSGFKILGERYSYAEKKYYACIMAEYVGEGVFLSEADAELGVFDSIILDEEDTRAAYFGYISGKITALERARQGKLLGGKSTSYEDELITEGIRRKNTIVM